MFGSIGYGMGMPLIPFGYAGQQQQRDEALVQASSSSSSTTAASLYFEVDSDAMRRSPSVSVVLLLHLLLRLRLHLRFFIFSADQQLASVLHYLCLFVFPPPCLVVVDNWTAAKHGPLTLPQAQRETEYRHGLASPLMEPIGASARLVTITGSMSAKHMVHPLAH
ncbi:hypothetical protein TEA_025261 [Camellia sinensis var. sinensis]|uniref:Uncharacterized protein n=1 Tax=Camellia sinensis var. sinensis TaxID=542762 RepID=A0A4S4EW46_CAMSN|nr:hypothetical protein TEA_025261 [Camellia sinensis var. sinensis]